jgi:hypothetical protein
MSRYIENKVISFIDLIQLQNRQEMYLPVSIFIILSVYLSGKSLYQTSIFPYGNI